MRMSLRLRLFVILAVAVLFAWIATAFFTYLDARHEIDKMLDARLVKAAELVVIQFAGLDRVNSSSQQIRDYTDTKLQIWQRDGHLLLRSSMAPEERMGTQQEGFANISIKGDVYRIYSHWDEARVINVRIGEHYKLRSNLAESIASHLLHPLYFAVPLLGLLIWLSVGAGLMPLSRFTREIEQREPDKLEPLNLINTPQEVLPLQNALNALFVRLQNSLEFERHFTADAAHELRTPLAAIKIQAQVAYAAHNPEQLQQSLSKVIKGTDRATRIIEQLFVLSRLDPEKSPIDQQRIKLSNLVSECVALLAPTAIAKGVDLGFVTTTDGLLFADATLMMILIRNLIDNAIRYTPADGHVEVQVKQVGDKILLKIIDTGPGIPKLEQSRVVSRFYRVLGSGEEGSGLGLSIVERIAELHGAYLTLNTGEGALGLVATVHFNTALSVN